MRTKKRLFIGLLGLVVVLILFLGLLFAYLVIHWEQPLNRVILIFLSGGILVFLGAVSFGIIGIVFSLWYKRSLPAFQFLIQFTMSLLFPIALLLGRTIGISHERIRSSFIEVNNQLIKIRRNKIKGDRILIIAPHCLQNSECPYKITISPDNCRRCGKCQVSALLSLQEQYGIRLIFATGGTLARRFVEINRPQAIIAIACERDLASGIQDTSPIPVLGILNKRPNGPCFNTQVDIKEVENAIIFFLDKASSCLSGRVNGK